jgi:hypothetical protein
MKKSFALSIGRVRAACIKASVLMLLMMSVCSDARSRKRKKAKIAEKSISAEQLSGSALSHSIDSDAAQKKVLRYRTKQQARDFFRQQEAKLSDISIPLHVKPITDSLVGPEQEGDVVLTYESSMSANDMALFYSQQMERLGWKQTNAFSGPERLMCFSKPDRHCAVSIRSHKKVTTLVLFVSCCS